MNHKQYFVRAVLIGIALCSLATFLATNAPAQINSGIITGIVTDPQKAVVPNAKVVVVDDSTKFSNTATTNGSGEFTVPYLKAGIYTVTVTAARFPVFHVTGVNVVTGNTARIDVPLQLSTVSTQVEVSATADQLQSDTTTVEGAVGEKMIELIPNITQNPLYYATLLEGVVGRAEMGDTTSPQSFGIGYDGRRFQSALNVDGAGAFSTAVQLDGLSVTSGAWNEASVLPNTDSLSEVRVVSSNYTAEFGRGMGVVKMATKSGNNQWHGSAYDRLRNEAFNANSFSNNAQGIARAPFRQNDFGGTVGGPIIKDKLFIFTSYEMMRHADTAQWLLMVPTAAQRIGDFSQTLVSAANGTASPVTIYDPNNVTQTGPTVYTRAPYPNAIIPSPNPYALKIMSIYGLPNRTPSDAFGAQNFFSEGNRTFSRSSNNSRLDYRRGNHSIYASGGVSIGGITTPSPWGGNSNWYISPTAANGLAQNASGGARYDSDDNPYVQLGDTVILSPTVVLDIRAGVNRIHSNYLSNLATNFTASDYTSLGVPASVQAVMQLPGAAPDFAVGSFANPSWTQSNNKHERQTNSQISGSVTKMRGKWTLKSGGEFRAYQGNYTDFHFAAADYQAAPNTFTVQNITAAGASTNNNTVASTGFAGASILTGGGGWLVDANQGTRPALTAKYMGLYSQNDWRATSRLTINLGLRWELQPPPTDRFNRASGLNLTETNAFGTLGAIDFPGNNGVSRSLWKTTWHDFGPRLGVAYRMKGNWVVRGGYGISYAANNTGWYDGPGIYGMAGFSPGTQNLPYGTSPNGQLVGHFWDSAASPVVPPVGANPSAPQIYGTGLFFFNVNNEIPPVVHMWNIFIERQLSRTWFVSAGYTGTHGSHLLEARFPLQNDQSVPAGVLATCRQTYIDSNGGNNPCTAQVQNPLQPATGALRPFAGTLGQRTIPMADTYYPYLALLGDTIEADNAWSDYHALKVRVRHSFAHGVLFDANYTWSKAIDNAYTELQDFQGFSDTVGGNGHGSNGLDIKNLKNDLKLSYADVPHRVVATVTYDLPFGQRQKFNPGNRVARAAVGGWRVASVVTWQRGYPLGPTGAAGTAMNARPDRNPAPNEPLVLPKNLQGWYNGRKTVTLPDGRTYTPCNNCYLQFNPDAFIGETLVEANGNHAPNQFWMGNAAIDYGDMRGPGRSNVDLTLLRDFRIRERYSVTLNARATNAFNHTQFRSGSVNMALGTIQTTDVPAQGLQIGMGQSAATYGSHSLNTFDPRQITFEMRVRF